MIFNSYVVAKTIQDETFYWSHWLKEWVSEKDFDEDCLLREWIAERVLNERGSNGGKILKAKVSISF